MSKMNRKFSNEGVKGKASGYVHYGNTFPQSKVALQPKHMGKSFWFRLREWLK